MNLYYNFFIIILIIISIYNLNFYKNNNNNVIKNKLNKYWYEFDRNHFNISHKDNYYSYCNKYTQSNIIKSGEKLYSIYLHSYQLKFNMCNFDLNYCISKNLSEYDEVDCSKDYIKIIEIKDQFWDMKDYNLLKKNGIYSYCNDQISVKFFNENLLIIYDEYNENYVTFDSCNFKTKLCYGYNNRIF